MKEFNKQKVRDVLRKNNLYTKQIENIIYHLNISNCSAEELLYSITQKVGLSSEEIARELYDLIMKCDSNNKDYDYKLDEEMTRFGTRTSVFYGGHCHNKWQTGTFEDDGFGFGTEITSLYDDYIDSNIHGKTR